MSDASPQSRPPHPAALAVDELLAQCTTRRTRRSGPGGQHRNKVETAVVIEHALSGIRGEAAERRSPEQNRKQAIQRLRVNLALGIRQPIGGARGEFAGGKTIEAAGDVTGDAAADIAAYTPSALWRSRTRGGRIAVRPAHEDFPALLAEALDVLSARGMDVKSASELLGVTSSQLVKLLKDEPRALDAVNDRRRELDLRPLR